MCLIIEHFAKKLVAVTRRLIYFPTVTTLKPNCPQVSWLSPTQLSRCPLEKNELTSHAQTSKGLFFFFFWKQAKLLSSSLWCVYQTCWNIALNWAPVASISQDKRLFRFPITLGHYHNRAPANIVYLLPTYVKVLFNSCGWNRGSVIPGCNPFYCCRKGVLRAFTASCVVPCRMGAVNAVLFVLHVLSASSWNNALLLFKMGLFSKKKKKVI